jgi:hypothetical protein
MTTIPKKIPEYMIMPGYNTKEKLVEVVNQIIEYLEEQKEAHR